MSKNIYVTVILMRKNVTVKNKKYLKSILTCMCVAYFVNIKIIFKKYIRKIYYYINKCILHHR